MGELGDGIFLLFVKFGLALPIEENYVYPDQDDKQEKQTFNQYEPIQAVPDQFRFVSLGEFSKFPMTPYKPVYPEEYYKCPNQLNADEGEKRVENFFDPFHSGLHPVVVFYITITQLNGYF